jgi:uncharacterized membrane-anchored protein
VVRCRFIVREGHQLQTIAAVYDTDWLQVIVIMMMIVIVVVVGVVVVVVVTITDNVIMKTHCGYSSRFVRCRRICRMP